MNSRKPILLAEEIQKTIQRLCLRIKGHFPDRDLGNVCNDLHAISKEADQTGEWITRPNYALRLTIYAGIVLTGVFVVLSVVYLIQAIHVRTDDISVAEFIQGVGASLDGLVLIGGGIIFLVTLENRRKRERVIHAINHLRCIAHIIDMHQLPKDLDPIPDAQVPPTELTPNELAQYLDYCAEMLSLVSKTGFLYVQHFHDPVATEAVNDLEDLCTGLARKIWQKIMVIRGKGCL